MLKQERTILLAALLSISSHMIRRLVNSWAHLPRLGIPSHGKLFGFASAAHLCCWNFFLARISNDFFFRYLSSLEGILFSMAAE